MSGIKQTVGELVYKITGDSSNLKTELKKSETAVKDVGTQMDKSKEKTEGFSGSLKKLAAGLGLVYLAKLAIDFGKASIQAYANAQQSIIAFNNAQENVAGSTKEQINDLNDYIQALEDKTTVDDKSIRQASQILAQDQIKIENQKKLLAGIVDIAVANSKSNGGEVDVQGTAVAVGRSLATGDVGALTRQNIVGIDEATQKTFKLGNEAQRTAILVKLLADNGKGAGEAYGNSFQGSLNRAKDTVEDLQKAIGKGLSVAMTVFTGGLSDTLGGLKITTDGTNKLGVAFTYLASLTNFVINVLKLMGISLLQTGNGLYQLVKITYSFGSDVIGVFGKVRTAIMSIGTAMKDLLTGNFSGAIDALKDGFDFSGVFDSTSKAFKEAMDSSKSLQDQFDQTTKDIKNNVIAMTQSGTIYKEAAKRQDELAEATDSANKASEKQKSLTDSQKDALKKLEEASDQYKNKFLDVVASIKSAVIGLNDDLKKSFSKFNDDFGKNIKDGATDLVKVFVDAEDKIKDLKKQLSEVSGSDPSDIKQRTDISAQIAEQQKVVDSRVDYEKRQAQVITDIKKKLADAGIDAEKAGLTSLTTVTDLKAQIKKEEDLRALGDFARQEEINKQKLFALTDQLIAEVNATKEKISKQEALEAELTAFLQTHNKLRLADVDAFANGAIAKYGEMAKALQGAISLQTQLTNLSGTASTPKQQFATGGYVGSKGGEVHPGEFVIPAHMVKQQAGLVAQLESARVNGGNNTSINAPINIQATMGDRLDASTVAKEIAWELGRM